MTYMKILINFPNKHKPNIFDLINRLKIILLFIVDGIKFRGEKSTILEDMIVSCLTFADMAYQSTNTEDDGIFGVVLYWGCEQFEEWLSQWIRCQFEGLFVNIKFDGQLRLFMILIQTQHSQQLHKRYLSLTNPISQQIKPKRFRYLTNLPHKLTRQFLILLLTLMLSLKIINILKNLHTLLLNLILKFIPVIFVRFEFLWVYFRNVNILFKYFINQT